MLKKFAELGTVHRNEPCQEYPGCYIVSYNGDENASFRDFSNAFGHALDCVADYDKTEQLEALKLSIAWQASDNDPRIGQVWFTGFFKHGEFNQFGTYCTDLGRADL